jgi:hypothetical protein
LNAEGSNAAAVPGRAKCLLEAWERADAGELFEPDARLYHEIGVSRLRSVNVSRTLPTHTNSADSVAAVPVRRFSSNSIDALFVSAAYQRDTSAGSVFAFRSHSRYRKGTSAA